MMNLPIEPELIHKVTLLDHYSEADINHIRNVFFAMLLILTLKLKRELCGMARKPNKFFCSWKKLYYTSAMKIMSNGTKKWRKRENYEQISETNSRDGDYLFA